MVFDKKKWTKDNNLKIKKYKKKYRENNPEKVKESQKKWEEKNKEKLKEYAKIYQSKPEVRRKAYVRFNTRSKYGCATKCSICGSENNVEYHHSEPYDRDVFIEVCIPCHREVHKTEEDLKEVEDEN